MLKDKRPYGCLLIKTHNDYYICVPFRSHIHHKNAFLFKNTERSKADSSGLDYSKTVLIRPEDYDKYLIENAVVDTDEYKAVRMSIYKIAKQISKYIEGYVKSVSDFENADKKFLNENTNIPRLNISMIFFAQNNNRVAEVYIQ